METVLVKIGGKAAENAENLRALCGEIKGLSEGFAFLLVHGGGADVTAISRKMGIEAVFKNGVRQTSPAEMDIVDMVLTGKVNTRLVRQCRTAGLDAVGICGCDGGSFLGLPIGGGGAGESRTAEMGAVDAGLLTLLVAHGYLPVISPTSMDERGRGMNINADSVAFGLAAELSAGSLVFLSDIPGVLKDGAVIPDLGSHQAGELVAGGTVSGGMIPKVSASLDALKRGVRNVIIGEYHGDGDLTALLEGRMGTRIHE
jgi:acetylglutamate kinase